MSSRKSFSVLTLIFVLLCGTAFAKGSRPLTMQAFVAMGDDATAVSLNPAALKRSIQTTATTYIPDNSDSFYGAFSLAMLDPTTPNTAFGVTFEYEDTNEDYQEYITTLTASFKIGPLAVGVNGNYYAGNQTTRRTSNIDQEYGIDIGLILKPTKYFALGGSLSNAFTTAPEVKNNSVFKRDFKRTARLGMVTNPLYNDYSRFSIAVDTDVTLNWDDIQKSKWEHFYAGTELSLFNIIAARGGIKSIIVDELTWDNFDRLRESLVMTAGGSLSIYKLKADYGYELHQNGNSQHIVTVSLNFWEETPTPKPVKDATYLIKKGEYGEAIFILEEFLQNNPKDKKARKTLANVLYQEGVNRTTVGKYEEASDKFKKALHYNPKSDSIKQAYADAEVLACKKLLKDNKCDEAISRAENALNTSPNNEELKEILVEAKRKKVYTGEIIEKVKSKISAQKYDDAIELLKQLGAQTEKIDATNDIIKQIVEGKIKVEKTTLVREAFSATGDYETRIAKWKRVILLTKHLEAEALRGQVAQVYSDAISEYEVDEQEHTEILEKFRRESRAWDINTDAMSAYKASNLSEAAEKFRQVLELDPNLVEAHKMLAITLAKQGQTEEAKTEFLKAKEMMPKLPLLLKFMDKVEPEVLDVFKETSEENLIDWLSFL